MPLQGSVTKTTLRLSFRSFTPNGLLLFAHQRKDITLRGDFLTVSLVSSRVEVKYDLGSGAVIMTSSQPVSLGSWHSVVFRRYHQDGILQVNSIVRQTSLECFCVYCEINVYYRLITMSPLLARQGVGVNL